MLCSTYCVTTLSSRSNTCRRREGSGERERPSEVRRAKRVTRPVPAHPNDQNFGHCTSCTRERGPSGRRHVTQRPKHMKLDEEIPRSL